jgi:hypothetical protein
MICGRWRDGTPLALSADAPDPKADLTDFDYVGDSRCLCVPKTKSERIDDEARARWRAKLKRRIAEPDQRPAHPFAKTDAF